MKVKELFKEVYDITTPIHFTIGDPYYFEDIASGKATKIVKSLVFVKERIPKCRLSKLLFVKEEISFSDEGDDTTYDRYHAKLIVTNKEYMETYVNDMYYPRAKKKNGSNDLGCDTAQYYISTTDRYGNIHEFEVSTGGDGYYGRYDDFVTPFGFIVEFSFCDDMYTEDEMRSILDHVFACPKIKKKTI